LDCSSSPLVTARLSAALLASALPAWRAAGVEPMVALRNE
jgi:ABC-type lipoprotein release transport system permease subunit